MTLPLVDSLSFLNSCLTIHLFLSNLSWPFLSPSSSIGNPTKFIIAGNSTSRSYWSQAGVAGITRCSAFLLAWSSCLLVFVPIPPRPVLLVLCLWMRHVIDLRKWEVSQVIIMSSMWIACGHSCKLLSSLSPSGSSSHWLCALEESSCRA